MSLPAILSSVSKLLALLPAGTLELFSGLVNKIIDAKDGKEREDLVRKAALAVGLKQLSEASMDAALKAKKKLKS